MLDKESSNTGFAMVTRKGFTKGSTSSTKGSTSEGKLFTKSSRGEYCTYCKRPGLTKDTYYKLYGKEKIWVNQTTFDKKNVVEHPFTSQLDQDIQAFSKEEMDHLRALLNSTSKPLGSCGLTMKGKSFFNIFGSVPQSIWIFDSGAIDHMTLFPSYFTSYLKVSKKQLITVANGDHILIVVSSNIQIQSSLSLHNVLHVPKLANNLISIHRVIQDWNCAITFFRSHCVILKLTMRRTIGVAKEQMGNNTNNEDLSSSQRATLETWTTSQIWLYHKHLGHPSFRLLKTMFPYLFTKEYVKSFNCDVCQFSKHHRTIFSPSNNKILVPFNLIHSNVWGPANNSISGAKWFVSFMDDCTHVTLIFLMKHTYEVCQVFANFFCLVKNQFDKSIKRLQLDNGNEFVNFDFSKFLKDNGVVHELMCVNTLQQNGVIERKNCHLLEVARALLLQMFIGEK
ncbi:hypothetical protein CR513_33085, partial [Mucuna pruriens]